MELELVPKDGDSDKEASDKAEEKPVYQGVERRKMARRTTVDRRSMVRFESKTDRRTSGERRADLRRWNGRD